MLLRRGSRKTMARSGCRENAQTARNATVVRKGQGMWSMERDEDIRLKQKEMQDAPNRGTIIPRSPCDKMLKPTGSQRAIGHATDETGEPAKAATITHTSIEVNLLL